MYTRIVVLLLTCLFSINLSAQKARLIRLFENIKTKESGWDCMPNHYNSLSVSLFADSTITIRDVGEVISATYFTKNDTLYLKEPVSKGNYHNSSKLNGIVCRYNQIKMVIADKALVIYDTYGKNISVKEFLPINQFLANKKKLSSETSKGNTF